MRSHLTLILSNQFFDYLASFKVIACPLSNDKNAHSVHKQGIAAVKVMRRNQIQMQVIHKKSNFPFLKHQAITN